MNPIWLLLLTIFQLFNVSTTTTFLPIPIPIMGQKYLHVSLSSHVDIQSDETPVRKKKTLQEVYSHNKEKVRAVFPPGSIIPIP